MNTSGYTPIKWGLIAAIAGVVLLVISVFDAPGLAYLGGVLLLGGAVAAGIGAVMLLAAKERRDRR